MTKVGQVAATFRLREIVINPSNEEKRRLKPATTVKYNIKSLNLGITYLVVTNSVIDD